MYIIECNTFSEFIDTIEELTKKGLCFHSQTSNLTIKLTGGY